jgi:hypothetical protein
MTMNWQEMIKTLVPMLGQAAVDELTDRLSELTKGTDDAWKEAVLMLMAEAVEKRGPLGVALAMSTINNLLEGKSPRIDWIDLRTASDVLAHLQNVEADRKKAVEDFVAQVSEIAGIALAAFLKGLIAAG